MSFATCWLPGGWGRGRGHQDWLQSFWTESAVTFQRLSRPQESGPPGPRRALHAESPSLVSSLTVMCEASWLTEGDTSTDCSPRWAAGRPSGRQADLGGRALESSSSFGRRFRASVRIDLVHPLFALSCPLSSEGTVSLMRKQRERSSVTGTPDSGLDVSLLASVFLVCWWAGPWVGVPGAVMSSDGGPFRRSPVRPGVNAGCHLGPGRGRIIPALRDGHFQSLLRPSGSSLDWTHELQKRSRPGAGPHLP